MAKVTNSPFSAVYAKQEVEILIRDLQVAKTKPSKTV